MAQLANTGRRKQVKVIMTKVTTSPEELCKMFLYGKPEKIRQLLYLQNVKFGQILSNLIPITVQTNNYISTVYICLDFDK
jgi:uncharacterized membrane protein